MKNWFIWALAALLVVGAQAKEEGASEGKKKAEGFAAIDTNGDGKISKKEYVSFQKRKAKEAGEDFDSKVAEADFLFLDKDGDEFLSKSEMASKGEKKKPVKEESEEGEQE